MVRVWDTTLNAWRDAKTIQRYDKERGAFVDVEAVYATVDGVKRQVWPDKLYLIKNGVMNTALGSLNTSIYHNRADGNNNQMSKTNASFSQGSGDMTFVTKGQDLIEGYGYVVSVYGLPRAGRKRLVIEASTDGTAHAQAHIGVITDSNYNNLIKNTKRHYPYRNAFDYSFVWKSIAFDEETPSGQLSFELDISDMGEGYLHLCMLAYASGSAKYQRNTYIKNLYLI